MPDSPPGRRSITRRRALAWTAGLGLIAAGPLSYLAVDARTRARAGRRIREAFADPELAALGRSCRRVMGGAGAALLLQPLLAGWRDEDPGLTVSGLGAYLRRKSREDYRTGRTVMVEGWVLSETESRLCAWLDAGGAG